MVSDPTVSPDGTTLAFTWRDDVWTAPIEGGSAIRITTDSERDAQPRFSPDGQEIAFVSSRSGSSQIYIVDIAGGTPRQITNHTEGYQLHDWFPDGNHLLASGNRDHHWRSAERMLKVSIESEKADEVLVDATASDASLDRKGERILFVREGERWWRKGFRGERSAQVWMLDLASKELTELLHEGVDCRWPIWHRNGKSFFFTKGDLSGFGLWRYQFADTDTDTDTDTGIDTGIDDDGNEVRAEPKQTQVADFEDDSIVFPSIAKNGHTIVFRHLFDLYKMDARKDNPPTKIELTYDGDPNIDEDELRRVLDRASEVAFTDDGLEIAFVAGGDIWAMDTELKEPVRITSTGNHESSILFGPEQESLFTVAKRNDQVDIYKIERNAKDGYWWQSSEYTWTQITNDPAVESDLRISPDGEHLFYVRELGKLTRRSLDDGEIVELTSAFSAQDYDVSPCGFWVAYAESDDDFNNEIWITAADGSVPPVNVSQHPDDDGNPKFSPDGKFLAFTGRRIDTESDIYYVYLQADESEKSRRERKLADAIELMKKKRKDDPKPKEDKSEDEKTTTEDSNADDAEKEEIATVEKTIIDFDGIEDRIGQISIGNSFESNLFWSPEGDKLAFVASIDGDRATYTVTFPDELTPKKLTSDTIGQPRWTKKAGAILGHLGGIPASVDPSGKATKYDFSAPQSLFRSERYRDGFEVAWTIMRDRWYDGRHANRNWAEVRRKYLEMAATSGDATTFGSIIELMLGELNGSHNGFYPAREGGRDSSEGWRDTTAHLGVRFVEDHAGPGLLVRDVLPGGPADRVESQLQAGDIVLTIDGTAVDPSMELTTVLNGRLDRDIKLLVERTSTEEDDETVKEINVGIRPISHGAARSLLYEAWLRRNREFVDTASEGRLGYLHIRSMDMRSFYEFERELYRVGYGREGLVIDVRDNGGGSTTDLLLTALTQPRHSITVPRDGGPGYPQSRMVYAVWQKPIIVLCNQNSYSNAEIFSHAIKNLGRGKLVGVETAGGVISTGSVQITDVGSMRMPFRGWFVASTGADMEMNGAKPDHILWPFPGEIPTGTDRQLELAVEVLSTELDENPEEIPELVYASELETNDDSSEE